MGVKLKHSSGNGTVIGAPAANPSADITLKAPSTTGSAGQVLSVASANHSSTNAELEWAAVSGGLTAAAQFRVTSSFTGDAAPISSNWEQVDSTGQGILGTWADPSSGVFTFPATGFYLVSFGMVMATAGQSAYLENKIQLTTDNGSNWHYVATGNCNISDQTGTTYEAGNYCQTLVDVTDTAQVKVRFDCNIESNSANVICNSTRNQTYVTLIRLGDT